MNHISNAFSLLALDVPDDELEQITTAANGENAKNKGLFDIVLKSRAFLYIILVSFEVIIFSNAKMIV